MDCNKKNQSGNIALTSVILILLLLTLTFVTLNFTRLVTRFGSSASPATEANITPLALRPDQTYLWSITKPTNYSGPVNVISWVCNNRLPLNCSSIREYKPWKSPKDNLPFLFTNGQMAVDQAHSPYGAIPEKIYYAKISPVGQEYSSTVEVNVTKYGYPEGSAKTEKELVNKYIGAIKKYLTTYPIENQPSVNGQTLGQINKTYANDPEIRSLKALEANCGSKPSGLDLEKIASWKGCAAGFAYTLMIFYAWNNNGPQTNSYAYTLIDLMDSLSSSINNSSARMALGPDISPTDSTYLLGETNFSKRYINDFGMGVMSGLSWLGDRIQTNYCTTTERPFDSGKKCKTVDLRKRIKTVAYNIATRTYNRVPDWNNDGVFQAWNAAGRVVAAKVSGDQNLINERLVEADKLIPAEFGLTTSSPNFWFTRGGTVPIVTSDTIDHMGVLLAAHDWNLPQSVKDQSLLYANIFFTNYFDRTHTWGNIDRNSYNADVINGQFPGTVVPCGKSGAFQTNPDGIISGLRGEPFSDAVLTNSPQIYHLLKLSGQPSLAQEMFDITQRMVDVIDKTPPDWHHEACNPSPVNGHDAPKYPLPITLREFAYNFFGLAMLGKSPFKSY